MERQQAPESLRLEGNFSASWKRFKRVIAGDEALNVFNNFKFEPNERKDDYKTSIEKSDAYCTEATNEVHERCLFRTRTQAEGDPFEKFLCDLNKPRSATLEHRKTHWSLGTTSGKDYWLIARLQTRTGDPLVNCCKGGACEPIFPTSMKYPAPR
ncbi:hypothetical protein V5799_011063 [Amblyomma americanum]|uniref:Uncharacterized protein n=1 Tax=Amblyomma americanum TaxID=6943 RepID=A0AAQ4EI85_AMBAM